MAENKQNPKIETKKVKLTKKDLDSLRAAGLDDPSKAKTVSENRITIDRDGETITYLKDEYGNWSEAVSKEESQQEPKFQTKEEEESEKGKVDPNVPSTTVSNDLEDSTTADNRLDNAVDDAMQQAAENGELENNEDEFHQKYNEAVVQGVKKTGMTELKEGTQLNTKDTYNHLRDWADSKYGKDYFLSSLPGGAHRYTKVWPSITGRFSTLTYAPEGFYNEHGKTKDKRNKVTCKMRLYKDGRMSYRGKIDKNMADLIIKQAINGGYGNIHLDPHMSAEEREAIQKLAFKHGLSVNGKVNSTEEDQLYEYRDNAIKKGQVPVKIPNYLSLDDKKKLMDLINEMGVDVDVWSKDSYPHRKNGVFAKNYVKHCYSIAKKDYQKFLDNGGQPDKDGFYKVTNADGVEERKPVPFVKIDGNEVNCPIFIEIKKEWSFNEEQKWAMMGAIAGKGGVPSGDLLPFPYGFKKTAIPRAKQAFTGGEFVDPVGVYEAELEALKKNPANAKKSEDTLKRLANGAQWKRMYASVAHKDLSSHPEKIKNVYDAIYQPFYKRDTMGGSQEELLAEQVRLEQERAERERKAAEREERDSNQSGGQSQVGTQNRVNQGNNPQRKTPKQPPITKEERESAQDVIDRIRGRKSRGDANKDLYGKAGKKSPDIGKKLDEITLKLYKQRGIDTK